MRAISTDRTDCGREAREAPVLRCASSGDQAVVIVEPAADGPGDEFPVRRLLTGQLRVRVGNPVDALVDAGVVVPVVDVLVDDGTKLSFVPDQDAV